MFYDLVKVNIYFAKHTFSAALMKL